MTTTDQAETLVDLLPRQPGTGGRIRLLGYPDVERDWSRDLPALCSTYRDVVAMPLTTAGDGSPRLVGALYTAEGALIPHSGRAKTNAAWAQSPEQLGELPGADAERLDGRVYFAGHYRSIFGHVLLEVLPRFWPDVDYASYDALLFYPQRPGRRTSRLGLPPYARDLVDAVTGGSRRSARIVARRPLRLAEVTVASPTVWLQRGFSPMAQRAFERAAERLVGSGPQLHGPRRVYLSRARVRPQDRHADNEAAVEELMTATGFTVVHPQQLPLRDQVALMRSAEVVAGCDGSALHLAAFARPGTKLVALDSRVVPNQFLVDDLAGLDAVHVLAAVEPAAHRSDVWRADLALVRSALAVAAVD